MMTGPYESEREAAAASAWAIRGRDTGMGIAAANLADLGAALAGVELGAYDRRIIEWLAGWEPATVAVVCGLIARSRSAAVAAALAGEPDPGVAADSRRCRSGAHASCPGRPCECPCHRPQRQLADVGVVAAEVAADVHRLAERHQAAQLRNAWPPGPARRAEASDGIHAGDYAAGGQTGAADPEEAS